MKAGFIYVLTHPSDPNLHKIGVTTRLPEKRLLEHNSDFSKYTGSIVKETGQKWELKVYHAVPDPYWAEKAFWETTPFPLIPFRYGVEVERMTWGEIERGLEAAKKAGIRPKTDSTPMPDWVYAYTASMRRRLEERDIALIGYVKSMLSGKANFRCSNGHEWRAWAKNVAEGEGCPKCGVGKSSTEEIIKRIGAGVICLLTHPEKPGLVNIGMGYGTLEEVCRSWQWGDWEMHRYRNVEEMALAEVLIWELLGHPLPHERQPIHIALDEAEESFRKLHYAMQEEIASEARGKESLYAA